ncbi:MAG: PaaI family thioesterase [Bacteroidia bacterium]
MFIPKDPNFKERIQHKMLANNFMQYIGFKATQIEAGKISGELILEEHHLQQSKFLHGGVTATLADLVAGFASFTLVNSNQTVVTSDLKISYLNPGIGQKVLAKGWVIKAGNTLHFAESEIICINEGSETLVAKGYLTFAVVNIP